MTSTAMQRSLRSSVIIPHCRSLIAGVPGPRWPRAGGLPAIARRRADGHGSRSGGRDDPAGECIIGPGDDAGAPRAMARGPLAHDGHRAWSADTVPLAATAGSAGSTRRGSCLCRVG
jgi:hypothetical protein